MTIYDKIIEGGLIAAIVLLLALLVTTVALAPKSCAVKADRMGMKHEFNYIGGCMIEARPGVWVPMNNYRVEDGRINHEGK